jgi:hypothetical protein
MYLMDSDFRPVKRPAKSLQSNLDELKPTAADNKNDFKTPEQAAADDAVVRPAPLKIADPAEKTPEKTGLKQKLADFWPPTKKEWAAAGFFLVALTLAITVVIHHAHRPTVVSKTARTVVKKAPPKPTTVASTLTGLQVDPMINQKTVTGVMIENSIQARPQSGLGQAGVVFEAIAEGGITRFLALFQDTAPGDIGPIRSARPYYAQWALAFDAGYAHVGGSPEALANIKAWGVKDLDQFHAGGSYHRISSRAAPHNVYTSIAALNQLETSRGYTTSTYTGFARKKESPSKRPTAKTINFSISGPVYSAHYDYDAKANAYLRSEGGSTHIDAGTNTQISPKVVIAMVIPYSLEADGYHSSYAVIGSGQAYIFQDGNVTIGQWSKTANSTQITFTDGAGQPVSLNPGQTWLTAVSAAAKVTYAP